MAAGLHDIGKANPIFQMQDAAAQHRDLKWRPGHAANLLAAGLPLPDPRATGPLIAKTGHPAKRHEYLSGFALGGWTQPEQLDTAANWLTHAVAGHHGYWTAGSVSMGRNTDLRDLQLVMSEPWKEATEALTVSVENATGGSRLAPEVAPADAGQAILLVTGLVMIADWLASLESNVDIGRERLSSGISLNASWIAARTGELTASVQASLGRYIQPVDPQQSVLGTFQPRPVQVDAIAHQHEPGLWMLAHLTGEGKTEASILRHTGRTDEGLTFALPTMATTDSMQARLAGKTPEGKPASAGMFGDTGNAVILSHSMSALSVCAASGSSYHTGWFDSPIRRLLAPVVACTVDQVLGGALRGKNAALRLLALANHHVVIDEVHTLDHYQSALLTQLLHWWGQTGTRVTLLSATLPVWQQRQFEQAYRRGAAPATDPIPYPGHRFSNIQASGRATTGSLSQQQPDILTNVTSVEDGLAAHIDWAATVRSRWPNIHLGIVVNTVSSAIKIAQELSERNSAAGNPAEVICLHSRMTYQDRQNVEKRLLTLLGKSAPPGGLPVTVVGTQVIEASLDVDWDLMSTDICPAPSLIQRVGRCRRFRDAEPRTARFGGTVPPAAVHVVIEVDRLPLPYLAAEINRVSAYLTANPVIQVPEDIQSFVDDTAFDINSPSPELHPLEIAEATLRMIAAAKSGIDIAGTVLDTRAMRYSGLVEATRQEGNEDLMGSRYIDRESFRYLLLPAGFPVIEMVEFQQICEAAYPYLLTVSQTGLWRALDTAADQIMPYAAWEPKWKALRQARPVLRDSLAALGLVYDAQFGLR